MYIMYVCMYGWMDGWMDGCMYVCLYGFGSMHSCMYKYRSISEYVTKGSLGYLSSMYFSSSLVLGEVVGPFPEIES